MGEEWDADDLVAARLIINIHLLIAHENREEITRKTGIDADRLQNILALREYPDGYEIALFQNAYGRNIWPGPGEPPTER